MNLLKRCRDPEVRDLSSITLTKWSVKADDAAVDEVAGQIWQETAQDF